MGENDTRPEQTVLFAPAGADIPTATDIGEWERLGYLWTRDPIKFWAGGVDAGQATDLYLPEVSDLSVTFELAEDFAPSLFAMLFGGRKGKRGRQAEERARTQWAKQRRVERRRAQRVRIGLTSITYADLTKLERDALARIGVTAEAMKEANRGK